jgi:hypothetical protein
MRPCTCDNVPPPGQPFTNEYCHTCWSYHNNPKYRAMWDGQGAPGIIRKARNLVVSVVSHVAAGMPTVSEEIYKQRLELCLVCPEYDNERCRKCGCRVAGNVVAKARWAKEKCPLGKW